MPDATKGRLVLTRAIGESIFIGENADIELTVVEIRGSKVRLAVQADKLIPVHRKEVFEQIRSQS